MPHGGCLALLPRRAILAAPLLVLARRATAAPLGLPAPVRTVPVDSIDRLAAALTAARPGDHLLLADGTYDGELVAARDGRAEAPVVIRAARPHAARIRGSVEVTGAHAWLWELTLEGAKVRLAADGARMSRCRQTDTDGIAVLVSRGRGVVVDRNELAGMRGRGISVAPDPRRPDALQGVHILRNHVRDFAPGDAGRRRENVHEGLQLGQSRRHTDVPLLALVEWNLFERVSIDSECVSIKSSDNLVRLNTLLDCKARITNRHGERNRIVANWLERTLGIAVHDRGNQVLGNVLVDSRDGIRIMGGDVAPDGWPGAGSHPAAADTVVAGNRAGRVTVGYTFDGHDIPATGTRVAGADGRELAYGAEARTTVEPVAAEQIPRAARLGPAEVGPLAD